MRNLRQLLGLLVFVVLAAGVLFLFLSSIALVIGLVGPLLGVAWAVTRLRTARDFWVSHGRFPIPDGLRIIGAGRARVLALHSVLSATGGLALGASPAAFVFAHGDGALALFLGGLALVAGAGAARRQVLAGSHAIDVLPPP
jgi:hypothetical protein